MDLYIGQRSRGYIRISDTANGLISYTDEMAISDADMKIIGRRCLDMHLYRTQMSGFIYIGHIGKYSVGIIISIRDE